MRRRLPPAERERERKRLFELFDAGATWVEIGQALGIPPTTARSIGAKYGLATKKIVSRIKEPPPEALEAFDGAPSPDDEVSSEDSLRLSPYVERRIKELGIHGTPVSGNALLTLQDA